MVFTDFVTNFYPSMISFQLSNLSDETSNCTMPLTSSTFSKTQISIVMFIIYKTVLELISIGKHNHNNILLCSVIIFHY